MQYLSVCSGIEAASVAFHPLGWKPVAFSEIEAFPSAVLAHHYPTVPNLGDMTKWAEWDWELLSDADILVGGTPCFTAGQLVLTECGYRPIESLEVGDQVLTHEGRLKPILRIGNKDSSVGKLTMVGRPDGIICTEEHPFLSVDWRNQNTKREGEYAKIETCSTPKWTSAKDMVGKQWCATVNTHVPSAGIPSRLFTERQAMYLAGMYLGDGWTRSWKGKNKKAVILGLNEAKYQKMLNRLGGCDHTKSIHRTGVKISFGDTLFATWLEENFGRLSHLKVLPAWVLSHSHRGALLEGYLDTDGNLRGSTRTINSTSESLAYGVADLLNIEGYVSSVSKVETSDTCVIEGRKVNQRDYFQVRANPLSVSRKARVRERYLLRTVQKWEPLETERVYNIEVADDNSFVLNGAIVHNCQAFSVAGLRAGLDDERGQLTISYIHLLDHIDEVRSLYGKEPSICVWENVPGVLSSKDNAFGAFLAGLAGEDCELIPSGGKWTDAGCVYGPKRSVAWRVLDAQYFGVAQRRKRVFVIASARDIDPSEILFEFDSLRRDTPPSRETGKGVASSVGGSSAFKDTPILNDQGGAVMGGAVMGVEDGLVGTLRRETHGHEPIVFPINTMACQGRPSDEINPRMGLGIGEAGDPQNTLTKGHSHAVAYSVIADPTPKVGDDICLTMRSQGGGIVPPSVAVYREGSFGQYNQDGTFATIKASGGVLGGGSETFVTYPIHDKATRHGGERGVSNGLGIGQPTDPCPTLDTGGNHAVATQGSMIGREDKNGPQGDGLNEEVSFTLNCVDRHAVAQSMQVRRLTPTECEALQGFPRNWTDVPYRNKPAVDGPRYKALGNSMAVPVMHWIGKRINDAIN